MDTDFCHPLTVADNVIEGRDAFLSARMRRGELLDERFSIPRRLSAMVNDRLRVAHSAMGHHLFSIRSQSIRRFLQVLVRLTGEHHRVRDQ